MAEVAAASVAIDSLRPQQSTALPRSAAPMSWLSGLNLSFQLSPNRYTFPLLSRQSMFQQAFFWLHRSLWLLDLANLEVWAILSASVVPILMSPGSTRIQVFIFLQDFGHEQRKSDRLIKPSDCPGFVSSRRFLLLKT